MKTTQWPINTPIIYIANDQYNATAVSSKRTTLLVWLCTWPKLCCLQFASFFVSFHSALYVLLLFALTNNLCVLFCVCWTLSQQAIQSSYKLVYLISIFVYTQRVCKHIRRLLPDNGYYRMFYDENENVLNEVISWVRHLLYLLIFFQLFFYIANFFVQIL